MSCQYLYIDTGWALCDCRDPKASGMINDHCTCDPDLCELTDKERGIQ